MNKGLFSFGQAVPAAAASTAVGLTLLASGSLSGTAVDVTGIPSTAKRITVVVKGLSMTGTDTPIVQLGNGSIDVASYSSQTTTVLTANTTGAIAATNGMQLGGSQALTGSLNAITTILAMGSNAFVSQCQGSDRAVGASWQGTADKTLAGTLDRIRITSVAATAFDAGTYAVYYE
jgi:hypothetical protein